MSDFASQVLQAAAARPRGTAPARSSSFADEVLAAAADRAPVTDKLKQAGASFVNEASNVMTTAVRAGSRIQSALPAWMGGGGEVLPPGRNDLVENVPGQEDSFAAKVGGLAGQAVAMAPAALGGPAGLAVAGAGIGAEQGIEDAQAHGAGRSDTVLAALGNAALGAAAAYGPAGALTRLGVKDAAARSLIGEMLQGAAVGAGQHIGADVVAKATYDPQRVIDLGAALETAMAMGTVSGGMGALVEIAALRNKGRIPADVPSEAPKGADVGADVPAEPALSVLPEAAPEPVIQGSAPNLEQAPSERKPLEQAPAPEAPPAPANTLAAPDEALTPGAQAEPLPASADVPRGTLGSEGPAPPGGRADAEPAPGAPEPGAGEAHTTDALLRNKAVRDELQAMADEAGTTGVGGQLIREEGETGIGRGKVIGRTRKEARAGWWNRRPGDFSEAQAKRAVKKALAGEKLNAIDQEVLDWMTREAANHLTPEEFAGPRPEMPPTSLKNRIADRELEEMGLDPVEGGERITFKGANEDARKTLEEDPSYAKRLIEDVRFSDRALTGDEAFVLLREKNRIRVERQRAQEELNEAARRGDYLPPYIERARALGEEFRDVSAVQKRAGTKGAQGLVARRAEMLEDYSLAALELRRIEAKAGKDLTDAEASKIAEQHKRMSELEVKLADVEEQLRKERFERQLDRVAKEALSAANRNRRRQKIASNKAEMGEIVKRLAVQKTSAQGFFDPARIADIGRFARLAIETGVLKFADFSEMLISQAGEHVKPYLADAWNKAREEYRQEMLGPAVEKLRKGESAQKELEAIARTLTERGIGRPRIVDAVHAAVSELAPEITREQVVTAMQERRLKASKARAESTTADLRERTAQRDFESRKPEELRADRELQRLRVEREKVRQEYERENERERLAQRTTSERVQDAAIRIRRGWILSSPNVVAKLTSAGIERMVFTPTEEAIGTAIHAAFPKLGAKAARESRLSIRAEAKAFTEAMTAGMRDAWQNLQNKQSDIEVLHGRADLMPRGVLEWMGSMHAALKAPTKRNEFARSLQKRTEWAIRNGLDPTEPLVQERLMADAYKDAQRSIFLNDNRVVDAYRRAINALKAPNKATGHPSASGKALATTAELMLPIVRVPTNIVAETMNYSMGLVPGGVKLAKAYRDGIENLSPERADEIMRHLKKGSIGGAVLLLGFFNPDAVGGYYQRGKRDEKDVGFGEVRVFGHDIPSVLLHNPLLETLQMGATMRRVAEKRVKGEEQGLDEGVLAAMLGLLEQVPFVRETADLSHLMEGPGSARRVAETNAADFVIPQLSSWLARTMDTDAQGKKIRRKSDGLWERIMERLPVLRERLPVRK